MKAMLAERWQGDEDPTGWFLSEKFDGVRAIWDGSRLMTRTGGKINAPEWFTQSLPSGVWLDGELWLGRGRFQELAGLVRRKAGDWSEVRYMVFDSPSNDVWEDRLEILRGIDLPGHVVLVDQHVCESQDSLEAYESELVDCGAEGVMLRRPGTYYVFGRSQHLQKMKRWSDDEAEVLEVDGGTLICEWWGKVIKLAASGLCPCPGDLVTFAYCGVTDRGLPRHTHTIAIRNYE